MLELRDVSKNFGGLAAVSGIDLVVRQGEILGLIGPNGAGKTTLFNLVSGVYRPDTGRLLYRGENITGLAPHAIAKRGIVRTFQLTTLFPGFTVLQNVLVGLQLHARYGFWETILNTSQYRKKEEDLEDQAREILAFLGLAGLEGELASNLPYGQQRGVSIAVALATRPEVMLLDEPISGKTTEERLALMGHIRQISERGITIVLIEHEMAAVMALCERICVLNFGRKIAEGAPEEIQRNRAVIEAYLGEDDDDLA